MPKSRFWPASLVVMGLVSLAQNIGLLPSIFDNFWPLVLIIAGLGGLVTSDTKKWIIKSKKKKSKKK